MYYCIYIFVAFFFFLNLCKLIQVIFLWGVGGFSPFFSCCPFLIHFMYSLEVGRPIRYRYLSASLRPPLQTCNAVASFGLCWCHEQLKAGLLFFLLLWCFWVGDSCFTPLVENESCYKSYISRMNSQKIIVNPEQALQS